MATFLLKTLLYTPWYFVGWHQLRQWNNLIIKKRYIVGWISIGIFVELMINHDPAAVLLMRQLFHFRPISYGLALMAAALYIAVAWLEWGAFETSITWIGYCDDLSIFGNDWTSRRWRMVGIFLTGLTDGNVR